MSPVFPVFHTKETVRIFLNGTPSQRTGTRLPSWLLLENRLYMSAFDKAFFSCIAHLNSFLILCLVSKFRQQKTDCLPCLVWTLVASRLLPKLDHFDLNKSFFFSLYKLTSARTVLKITSLLLTFWSNNYFSNFILGSNSWHGFCYTTF